MLRGERTTGKDAATGRQVLSAGCLMNAIVAEIEAEVRKEEQSWTYRP
jgi:hypothetical protein